MVSASASEPVDCEFYPRLCSYSVLAIICNASLLQVRPMVTSKLVLTCCKLVSHLHSCRVKLAASLQICSASLLQTKIAIWENMKSFKSTHVYFFLATQKSTAVGKGEATVAIPDRRSSSLISVSSQTLIGRATHGPFHLMPSEEDN
ncbi:hypothetical protein AVEN_50996-1 [Araneus ventricosus]|uniref:Uncharacterized protein n=1 Tax=Araneus ventricosus TaxID=182803 RepID=A0A4Y2RF76_ARAVE|nr:hypothetical protein AVEN_50996-1 [Araneus ventricosus]